MEVLLYLNYTLLENFDKQAGVIPQRVIKNPFSTVWGGSAATTATVQEKHHNTHYVTPIKYLLHFINLCFKITSCYQVL